MPIPTLHSGTIQIINTREDVISYSLVHSVQNPGNTSELIEDDLVSLRKLEATYDKRIHDLAAEYQNQLQNMLNRIPEAGDCVVTVTVIDLSDVSQREHTLNTMVDGKDTGNEDTGGKVSLQVAVTDAATEQLIIPTGKISSDNEHYKIHFN